MVEDARLTRRHEAAEVLRCLRESLREPLFARCLALLVAVDWRRSGADISSGVGDTPSDDAGGSHGDSVQLQRVSH